MSWRRSQSNHEMIITKKCRYCKGSGRNGRNRCQACRGSGQAKTMYRFWTGGRQRG